MKFSEHMSIKNVLDEKKDLVEDVKAMLTLDSIEGNWTKNLCTKLVYVWTYDHLKAGDFDFTVRGGKIYDPTDKTLKLKKMDAEEIEDGLVHHFWIVKDGKKIDESLPRLLETMPEVGYIEQRKYAPIEFLEDVEIVRDVEEE